MRLSVAVAIACLSVGALSAADDVKAAIRRNTEIPAQGLGPALQMLAKEHGFQIVYISGEVNSLRTQGASGELTAEEALTRILRGTGMTFRSFGDNAVSIVPVATGASSTSKDQADHRPESVGWFRTLRLAQVDERSEKESSSAPGLSEDTLHQRVSTLEEVIVTAQKREERLIDAPQSVSVVSSEVLMRMGATQFRDFADTVPGLTFQSSGAGNTMIAMRGVTAGFDISPTVGIYVDDVPYGSSSAFAKGSSLALDVGLYNLDRIEVLRGPQGTLYGASTMGGLIKYVTREPDSTAVSVDAQSGLSTTREGGVSHNAALGGNLPLMEGKAAIRASAFYNHDAGYIDNLALGDDDVNEADIYGGRFDLLLTPSDALRVRLNAFLQNISRDGQATADYTFAGQPVDGAFEQRRFIPETFDQRFRLFSGTVQYELGAAQLTSISSYQTAKSLFYNDLSTTFIPILAGPPFNIQYSATGYLQHQTTEKYTQEFRLASNTSSGERTSPLEWLLGAYYTHEHSTNDQGFTRLYDLAGNLSPNIVGTFAGPSQYKEIAGFANLTYHFTDQFDISGGLRYAENRQRYTQFGSGFIFQSFPTNRSDESVVTYLANARYKFNDHATGYVRFATGFRPGGPNFVIEDPATGELLAPLTYDSDSLQSYEIGLKAESSDRRFGVDIAAYTIDWKDMQTIAVRGGLSVNANAGKARINGAELTLTARPVQGLTAAATLAYQDAHLAEDSPDLGGFKDDRLPNVPRTTASLNADYEAHNFALRPTFGTTVRYVSDRNTSFDQSFLSPQYELPDYTVVDLRTGFALGSVDLRLYVHNVFDERAQLLAPTLASSFNGPMFVTTLQPRTFGLSASTRF